MGFSIYISIDSISVKILINSKLIPENLTLYRLTDYLYKGKRKTKYC